MVYVTSMRKFTFSEILQNKTLKTLIMKHYENIMNLVKFYENLTMFIKSVKIRTNYVIIFLKIPQC